MIATSNRLQKEADNERLALFIGAGASFPSGLPSWAGLVEQLSGGSGEVKAPPRDIEDAALHVELVAHLAKAFRILTLLQQQTCSLLALRATLEHQARRALERAAEHEIAGCERR